MKSTSLLTLLASAGLTVGSAISSIAAAGTPARNLERDLGPRVNCGLFSIRPPKHWQLTKTVTHGLTVFEWSPGAPASSPIRLVVLPQTIPSKRSAPTEQGLLEFAVGFRKSIMAEHPDAKVLKSGGLTVDHRPGLSFVWGSQTAGVGGVDTCTAAGRTYYSLVAEFSGPVGNGMFIAGESLSTFHASGPGPTASK